MHIIYENEYGMISMGKKQSPWRLIGIKGLNIPEKSHSVVRYGNFGGQQTVFSVPDARIITISGDFYSENIGEELCNALRIFNSRGTLSVISGDKQRLIKCSQITFEEIERKRCYLRFALQFVCDNPYFNDLFPNVTGIFERKGSLKNSFTLPCSFSTRNSNKYVVNSGDEVSEPTLKIYVESVNGQNENETKGYKISNLTTGKFIWLVYEAAAGEVIEINIGDRTITSSKNGNIISKISDDTFLSDFNLKKGANLINVLNYNPNETLKVECIFNNSYVEAVY